ncbi:nuclear transport factor 2 family protein [Leptolyngbya sp. 7M]|nr:nuclear transport factor 2 family protein [Leptolyngbya sp. 7M]
MSNSTSSINPTLSAELIHSVVQQYFAASRSSNQAEAMVACFAVDSVTYDPAERPGLRGHQELQQFFQGVLSLFETVGLQADFISINGNEAAVKWTGYGVGRNGKSVTFEGIDLFQFNSAGKIQTMRAYWDPAAMLAKLQEGA